MNDQIKREVDILTGPLFDDEVDATLAGHEPAFPSHGTMGEVAYQGITAIDFFAVHCDLDMHRGAQGGIGTVTAKLVMESDPPIPSGTITSLKWWAEAESRYRYLKAQAMVKAREWVA